MPATLIPTRQPLDATQQGLLRTMFSSPAFSLFKEMVVARCVDKQISAMNAAIYPENEVASNTAQEDITEAVALNGLLDLLDDLENQEQEWWMIKVEPRR